MPARSQASAGTARVDRDIDRLLRRVGPGDIVVLDALDLDRITADALVEAEVAAVVNASPSISGRYPNLGPEVLVANGVDADRRNRARGLQEGQGRRQGPAARRRCVLR